MTDDVRKARTAFLWVGVIVPLAIISLSTAVIAAWLPEIPNPAATHWGTDGVDGYGPAWTYIALPAGLGGGMVALFSVLAYFGHRMPPHSGAQLAKPWSPAARLLGATNLGLAWMMSFTSLISVYVQRGLTDAADTPDITLSVFIGLGMMLVMGAIGWFLQPAVEQTPIDEQAPAEPLQLGDSERAAWVRTASTARTGQLVLGLGILVVIGQAVFFATAGDSSWIILAVLAVALLALCASMLVFRVTANAQGLLVRSAIGFPRFRVLRSEIRSAHAVTINPFAEFGGWGYRIGADGRRGVVLRAGDALQITRTDGRVFVVTVDDAATAAAVLTSVVKETRS